jgi:hypothetical protein|tara:strand:+ start:445 stop:954 length:510 start_codon:yes stop_codon:yes gene_type:complete
MEKPIRNKVAEAGLITVDLLDYIPKENIKAIDLKDWLINGLIIKELDFKNKLDNFDFFPFENCNVYIYCSKDVIIPVWAFLLLQVKLNPIANYVFFGTKAELNLILFKKSIENNLDLLSFKGKRVFIKGCGDSSLPLGAFSIVSEKLTPIVKSLFYGEACSNVPLIKNM